MSDQPPWPKAPREPGPWDGGPPVAPPGNTPLPPLPGPGGVSRTTAAATNPWRATESGPALPPPPPPPTAAPGPPFATLDTASIPRIDRAPRWLVVAAAAVVIGLLAGGTYVVTKGGPQYPSEWDARVEPIAAWVAEARELDFDHPVEVLFLSEAEYRSASTEGSDAAPDNPEASKEEDDTVAQLRALGLVAGKVDLGKASDTLSDTGTLAFYDPGTKKVYARGTELTPLLRVTLAHELVHVLQDQHYDLTRLGDLPEDEGPVLRALAEGDAERIENEFIDDVLTEQERAAYDKDLVDSTTEAFDTIDEEVPPVLSALFQAPYIFGPALVAHLGLDGDALDTAFEDVPNEEVLFNPLIFGTPAAEGDPIEVDAPAGAEELDDGQFGPTAWYLVLASRLAPATALTSTDGLGGDGYVVYREKGTVCAQVHASGDTPQDVDELAAALGEWVEKSPPGSASVEKVDGQVRFRSCDPGDEVTAVGEVRPELLLIPVTRTQVHDEMTGAGAPDELANCFATKVVTTLTLDQLIDEDFLSSDAGQQALLRMRQGC